jgi:uncharacterized protein (DUF433 family)
MKRATQAHNLYDRISIDPVVCHGKPVIKNTRVLVSNILADLATGQTYEEIIENYPNISGQDIQAALQFGSHLAQFETLSYKAG